MAIFKRRRQSQEEQTKPKEPHWSKEVPSEELTELSEPHVYMPYVCQRRGAIGAYRSKRSHRRSK